jgi:formyltetrahydrofolate deformylase
MSRRRHGILLISCRDAPGIVAAVARFVYEQGGNILDSDQHTDSEAGIFFIRLVFELEGFELPRDEVKPQLEERLRKFLPKIDVRFADVRKRAAILVSKYDHCLYDLLLRQRSGEIDCDFSLVVSNHPDLEPVAEHFGVPYHVFPSSKESRRAQEDKVLALLDSHGIDFAVLARYMQILTPEFVDLYPARIINIHHSFLPAFRGPRPYHQAHQLGVKLIGATSHYVTAELDRGPIIEQDVVRVSHRDSVADLVRKGRDLEKVVLARAVRWHVEDRILPYANKTVVFR